LEGDCHYLDGNINAKRRVHYVAKLLDEIGLGAERIFMLNFSSAMGAQFAKGMQDVTEKVRGLGPNPLSHMEDLNDCR